MKAEYIDFMTKSVIYHPLSHNLGMMKLLAMLAIITLLKVFLKFGSSSAKRIFNSVSIYVYFA